MSVYQTREHNIVCVQLLAREFGSTRSFVQTIRNDSSDIVEVIRQAYEVMPKKNCSCMICEACV